MSGDTGDPWDQCARRREPQLVAERQSEESGNQDAWSCTLWTAAISSKAAARALRHGRRVRSAGGEGAHERARGHIRPPRVEVDKLWEGPSRRLHCRGRGRARRGPRRRRLPLRCASQARRRGHAPMASGPVRAVPLDNHGVLGVTPHRGRTACRMAGVPGDAPPRARVGRATARCRRGLDGSPGTSRASAARCQSVAPAPLDPQGLRQSPPRRTCRGRRRLGPNRRRPRHRGGAYDVTWRWLDHYGIDAEANLPSLYERARHGPVTSLTTIRRTVLER